ncbi:sulfatase [Natronomonas salina]|uniref:sulfatase n=1 Tax=Natronomonas salina TaxID=1710540 RepID=UPI0015B6A9B9|nr:sulfatase [Natronomonas salina]QLD90129.1 sulfatase [Natronomonas salina]
MTRPSNVVFVVLDTARASDAPPVREETMPTLAELAAEGTAYEHAFACAPWSVPSHASLFTGAYPSRHGAHGDHTYLDEGHRTVAESFADSGYETIGVSNNTWITEEFGFARGFDSFWKGWQYWQSDADMGTVARADQPREKLRRAANNLFDGNPAVNAANIAYSELLQPAGDDGAARTTDRIESWLDDRDADRPFFAFVNYLEPHIDYRPPEAYAERFLPAGASFEEAVELRQDPRAYDVGEYDLTDREFRLLYGLYRGELAYVDEQLDRLRTALADAGEWEDTLLVVCGDHGENVGDHGFLGHQYNLYDTLLHVPLVCHGGAFTGGAGNADALVQLSDLVPTLLDAAGIDDPTLREQCQGPSFHPEADAEERDAVYAEYVAPQPSMERLEERFDGIPESVREYDRSLRAIRTREYKLIRGSDGLEELYDVVEDPGERTDLSATHRDRVTALGERLESWHGSFEHAEADGEVEVDADTERRLESLGYM